MHLALQTTTGTAAAFSIASFNIVRGVQNIYDGDSVQNVGWQTAGKQTSSNHGVSDYILQICLPKTPFPLQSTSFSTPRDERL